MRRLTLILSDLYLPEEAGRELSRPDFHAMPQLEWLLRFSRGSHLGRGQDWRTILAAELGYAELGALALAALAARGVLEPSAAESAWLATPVRLEARLDHVRLRERGLARLTVSERDEWRQEFARKFAPFELHDVGARGFLLTGLTPAAVATVDPARVLDADISPALPAGPVARELRRLGAEIEMWMHSAPGNVARSDQSRLSALWMWGGGQSAPAVAQPQSNFATQDVPAFHGDDPVFAGLARAVTGAPPADVPAGFSSMPDATGHTIVELAPMSGPPRHVLPALDRDWFAPARAALSNGSLPQMDIIANDRWFRIAARPGWRRWRRRRSWLEQLARSHTKA